MQIAKNIRGAIVATAIPIFLLPLFLVHLQAEDVVERKPLPKFIRNAVIADRYLGTREVEELLQFERVEAVCLQLLKRPNIPFPARSEALKKLAELRQSDTVAELLPWIEQFNDEQSIEEDDTVLQDLVRLLPFQPRLDLQKHRPAILSLTESTHKRPTREAALASLATADGSTEAVWQLTESSQAHLLDVLSSITQMPTDIPREPLYAKVKPLLQQAPSPDIQAAAIEAVALLNPRSRETFETLNDFVLGGTHVDACVRAISKMDQTAWTADRRLPLAEQLLTHLEGMPLSSRTSQDAKNASELTKTLAGILPSTEEKIIQSRLDQLTVKVIPIKTIEEQMRYDQTVLVLRTGQGVQIVFDNHDIMPHNLVVVDSPAAREEVGIAADRMQNDVDAIEKGYLPDSDQILHASTMLQPGEKQSLFFKAPEQAGIYAYVCTFPGHWSKMYGAIVVVDQVDDYLAANQRLPSADELLGIQTVEWTYERLTENLSSLDQNRSFENGQQMFLKASCFSCHQVANEGGRIGPDLTKISEQYKQPSELLTHIMNPSEKVEQKYATVIVETGDGQILRGVVVDDGPVALMIKEDPLSTCDPIVINKDNIEDVSHSRLSPMPEQLLNTIVEESHVYDLLAYLISGGNPKHPLFQDPQ